MKDRFLLKMIWIAAYAAAFVDDFARQRVASSFDSAMRHTTAENAWYTANAAVAAFKHHRGPAARTGDGYRGGWSPQRQEPGWD